MVYKSTTQAGMVGCLRHSLTLCPVASFSSNTKTPSYTAEAAISSRKVLPSTCTIRSSILKKRRQWAVVNLDSDAEIHGTTMTFCSDVRAAHESVLGAGIAKIPLEADSLPFNLLDRSGCNVVVSRTFTTHSRAASHRPHLDATVHLSRNCSTEVIPEVRHATSELLSSLEKSPCKASFVSHLLDSAIERKASFECVFDGMSLSCKNWPCSGPVNGHRRVFQNHFCRVGQRFLRSNQRRGLRVPSSLSSSLVVAAEVLVPCVKCGRPHGHQK